jgi:hypothetical protein
MSAANAIFHIRKLLAETGPRQTALALGRHPEAESFHV